MTQQPKTILETMNMGAIDAKGFVDDSVRDEFFKKFRSDPATGNRTCLDCPHRNPQWISLSHGTFVCLECSGEHRRKGVHISFVRSADMDKFTVEQLTMMAVGGNTKAREYFKKHGMGSTSESGKPINYTSNAALKYRQQIEQTSHDLCKKLGAQCKTSSATVEKEVMPAATADPFASNADFFNEGLKGPTSAPKAVPKPAVTAVPKTVHQASAPQGPSSTVVRKAAPPPAKGFGSFSSATAKGKPAAKEIDFDFDFDDIEKEANVPKAVPSPVKQAPAQVPPSPKQMAPMQQSGGYVVLEVAKANAPEPQFDDFFNDIASVEVM